MINTLNPGHIGLRGLGLHDSIALAKRAGFRAVAFDIVEAKQIADDQGIDAVKSAFVEADVLPGDWFAPIDWQGENRAAELEKVKPIAEFAAEIGAPVTLMWVMPADNDRDRDANYAWWLERLTPFGAALNDAGVSLALEFIGPKTLRDQFTHPFIWRWQDVLQLGKDAGTGNIGLLFDTFHFYTSGGEIAEIATIDPADILLVHTNDAALGRSRDEQLDGERTLPMETGVLPAPAIIAALHKIGYRGLVESEPFSASLRELAAESPDAAAQKTFAAQSALFAAAGVET